MGLFTVPEARAELARLRPVLDELVRLRADAAELAASLRPGGRETALGGMPEWKAAQARLDDLMTTVQRTGAELKGFAPLLVDFPAEVDGVDVLLCWLEGDPELCWYHRVDLGFAGRRRLPDRVAVVSEEIAAGLFDGVAEHYDQDAFHGIVAEALVDGLGSTSPDRILDVATGTGVAAFAALRLKPGEVLAIDISPGMIAKAEAKSATQDPDRTITWQVASAVPSPVEDEGADAVLCASSLHFLGTAALRDWLRALRPGGRVGFSLPLASAFRPSEAFAAIVPADLKLPSTEDEAAELAAEAGFTEVTAKRLDVESGDRTRSVFLVHATKPER
jgi:arsenite methyltransferase